VDNIKRGFKEIELECVDWINLAQNGGKVAGTYVHNNEPSDSILRYKNS
jgi:phosphopantetheine adenylyltransferase